MLIVMIMIMIMLIIAISSFQSLTHFVSNFYPLLFPLCPTVDLLLRFASKLNKTQVEVEVEVEDKISDDEGSFSSSGPVTKFVRLDSLGSWKSSGKPR